MSEPLPSNNSDFLTESFEASKDGAGRRERFDLACSTRGEKETVTDPFQ